MMQEVIQFVKDIAPFFAIATSLVTIVYFIEQKRLIPHLEKILGEIE